MKGSDGISVMEGGARISRCNGNDRWADGGEADEEMREQRRWRRQSDHHIGEMEWLGVKALGGFSDCAMYDLSHQRKG